jgi:hypothetical protein
MSKSKISRKAATALEAANAADGIATQEYVEQVVEQVVEQAPVAVILAPAPAASGSKLRKSAPKNPVAQVWANCHNAFAAAKAEGKPAPSRAALHVINTAMEIAYYTSRTQIQAYLKASRNGTVLPAKLPKGLTIN